MDVRGCFTAKGKGRGDGREREWMPLDGEKTLGK